jgi:hypothetical protein
VSLTATARDARNAAIAGATGTTFATSDRAKALVDASGVVTTIAPDRQRSPHRSHAME